MKILYYDCFAGISGDMNLAALIDAGVDCQELKAQLEKLNLEGWKLRISKSSKSGIFGTRLDVDCNDDTNEHHHHHHDESHHHHDESHHHHDESHHHHHEHSHNHSHEHRKFSDIKLMIENSTISENAKKISLSIFERIAEAEAKVHNVSCDDVSFHEVGAVDSIIDIVGCGIAIDMLKIDKIYSSPVELGGGVVRCAHGLMPVPAPATAILAKAFDSKIGTAKHECTTPTGAAIIASLCEKSHSKIEGKIIATGIGVGHRDSPDLPNILRVTIIETAEKSTYYDTERLVEFSANIDDMTAEHIAELISKLFQAGSLDAWQENILMKKSRAGTKVCAMCKVADREKLIECFFTHSTTLGLREIDFNRHSLKREIIERNTPMGKLRFKKVDSIIERIKPEFEDCKIIAKNNNLPIDILTEKLKNEF